MSETAPILYIPDVDEFGGGRNKAGAEFGAFAAKNRLLRKNDHISVQSVQIERTNAVTHFEVIFGGGIEFGAETAVDHVDLEDGENIEPHP